MKGELVFIQKNRVVTDSLTVAEAFGKEHRRVLQDIRELECSETFRVHNFVLTSYVHSQNKQTYPKYLITQDGFSFLVMGYTGKEAARFKELYINEFNRMKGELAKIASPSYSIDDPIKRAERWIQEQKERLMLEQQVKENQAKATYYDTILQSTKTVTVTQIAKDYGLSGMKLNKVLHAEGVQYKLQGQWLLYQKYQAKGYTKSKTHMDANGEPRMHTYWTQKGRLFIHNILSNRGIEPLMDREVKKEA